MQNLILYNNLFVNLFAPNEKGVYYCIGNGTFGNKEVFYVGSSTRGIRVRLNEHLLNSEWPDIGYFTFTVCSSDIETLLYEKMEIAKYRPKYNINGK